jgi:hypothetical protein
MTKVNLYNLLKLSFLVLLAYHSGTLSATKASKYYWGTKTPIRASLNYATNNYRYNKGDVQTITFRIYVNKNDTLYYEPGNSYLLDFDFISDGSNQLEKWKLISTSIESQKVFLDDTNSSYSGTITVKCRVDNSLLSLRVSTFRIAKTDRDSLYNEYDFIDEEKHYRADQFERIVFRNTNVWLIQGNEMRYLDFDESIQKQLRNGDIKLNLNQQPDFTDKQTGR